MTCKNERQPHLSLMRVKPDLAPSAAGAPIVVDGALAAVADNTLASRLNGIAAKLGGKRALARAAGLSEAQLFRYVNGDSEMSVGKAEALARAAGVQLGWLLTGEENLPAPPRPDFDPATMARVVQTFEEYMFEYPVKFTPKQRGQFFALVYEAMRHDQHHHNVAPDWSRENMFFMLDFASALKKFDEIATYHQLFEKVEIARQPLSQQEAMTLDRMAKLGGDAVYNGVGGKMYYDRMTQAISPTALQGLLDAVQMVTRQSPGKTLQWLDMGCGNGRHLLPLTQHAPHLKLHGCDSSAVAAAEIMKHVRSGKLPENVFEMADMRTLPYGENSFDAVWCRNSLYMLPFIAGAEVGMKLAFGEIARVLKPGGTTHIIMPHGKGRHWLQFWQYVDEADVAGLVAGAGLQLLSHRCVPDEAVRTYDFNQTTDYTPSTRTSNHVIIARKPA